MRIGMLLDTAFPPDSRVENEAVSLLGDGHEVYLFSLDYQGNQPERETINGIRVCRFRASHLTYRLSALAYSLPLFRARITPLIRQFVEEVSPDVLHIHDMVLGDAGMRVASDRGLPVVLDLHENRPVIMRQYIHLKKFPGKYIIRPQRWERAQRRLVQQANRVIVVTPEARDELVRDSGKSPEAVTVVPNTIHPAIYLSYPVNPGIIPPSADFTLLYMGDTGLRRGTDTAIRALSILRNAGHNARLVLVGSNSEDPELRKLTGALGLDDYVLFEGWQDVRHFPSYTVASDICLSPLKRNLHHDTTFANKIFQYMAFGKPLVVSDCPAQARVVREERAGLVHRADDPSDLAAKVITLIENATLRKKMGEHARLAVQERWNWKQTSQDLLQMYRSLTDHA